MSSLDNAKYDSCSLQGSYRWNDTLKGIYYGPGSVNTALPKLLDVLGTTRALIVTGKSLHDKVNTIHVNGRWLLIRGFQTDVVKTVENILKAQNAFAATFYDIGEHAPIAGIRNGVKAFRDAGADVIVAIGGGSPIDAAKAIIYTMQQESGGAFYRQISIPTTLSAAEYTVSYLWIRNVATLLNPHRRELDIPMNMVIRHPSALRSWLLRVLSSMRS